MDAKCPDCDKVAVLDDNITIVKCNYCGFEAKYDEYIEIMKQRVGDLVTNFNPDRAGS
ncbi:MAG: zinc-domain-containing protein [Nitrosopumilaceae archaeon]